MSNKKFPILDEPSFCSLPFLSMALFPRGEVLPCCFLTNFTKVEPFGDVRQSGILEIWNNEKFQSLRNEFLNGKPLTCARAMSEIGCNKRFSHLNQHVVLSSVQAAPPKKLDIRLNGQCNIECKMCHWWQEPNGVYDTSDFWERGAKEIFPGLLEIDVLGGEPLIQRDTFRLIDAVSSVNSSCRWFFVTNGQYRFADKVKSYFDKIALRTIALSVDSLRPNVFSEIRRLGSLERALKTLDDLIEYRDSRKGDFTIELIFTVMRDNWSEASDVIAFAASKGIGVTFNFVFAPHELSLLSLADSPRQMVLDYYDERMRSSGNPTLDAVIAPLRASLDALGLKT